MLGRPLVGCRLVTFTLHTVILVDVVPRSHGYVGWLSQLIYIAPRCSWFTFPDVPLRFTLLPRLIYVVRYRVGRSSLVTLNWTDLHLIDIPVGCLRCIATAIPVSRLRLRLPRCIPVTLPQTHVVVRCPFTTALRLTPRLRVNTTLAAATDVELLFPVVGLPVTFNDVGPFTLVTVGWIAPFVTRLRYPAYYTLRLRCDLLIVRLGGCCWTAGVIAGLRLIWR